MTGFITVEAVQINFILNNPTSAAQVAQNVLRQLWP